MNDQRKKVAREMAAQLWCLPQHSHKTIDAEFAESIAEALLAARDEALELAANVAALNMAEQTAHCGWSERARTKAIEAAAGAIRELKGNP